MSIKTMVLGLIAVVGILSACHSTEPTHSVDWFIEHPEDLKDAIAKCNRNPGELAATSNCINAKRAQGKVTWEAKGVIRVEPLKF